MTVGLVEQANDIGPMKARAGGNDRAARGKTEDVKVHEPKPVNMVAVRACLGLTQAQFAARLRLLGG